MNRNNFISNVFRWFGIGLFITFFVGYLVSKSHFMLNFLFSSRWPFMIIIILEIGIAIWLGARIRKMSIGTAKGLYMAYTALTGLTFSTIFLVYEMSSIIWIFLATSVVFFIFAYIGKRMNVDLRKMGIYLMVLLFAVILLEVINIFLMNQTLDMFSCILALVVFVAYVAYDIRKLDYYEDDEKFAIIGAFDLYLDFINIFLRLLELFGKSKD